jgi:hypothetical protein
MNHAFKSPKPSRRSARAARVHITPLDRPIELRKLRLALDSSKGLLSEWEGTCGSATIKAFVTYCEQYDGIHLIQNPVSPGAAASKQLKLLGFGADTVDKLIVRIALATQDRFIVSNDSDFWDPTRRTDRHMRGNPNAPVARFCKQTLGVTIMLLGALLQKLARENPTRSG